MDKDTLKRIDNYILEHYVAKRPMPDAGSGARHVFYSGNKEAIDEQETSFLNVLEAPRYLGTALENALGNLDEPFSTTIIRLINAKSKNEVEVYKKANIDRKLFSKIRSGKKYKPSKRTVLALAIALELDISETEQLLKCAGFALSHSCKGDIIVKYFIKQSQYSIFDINEVLFHYDEPLLGR